MDILSVSHCALTTLQTRDKGTAFSTLLASYHAIAEL
jgi:hypothetical protein